VRGASGLMKEYKDYELNINWA